MKVRVKYSNTQKFVLNVENPTLGNLKDEIRGFIENTYKESVKEPLTISLNGSDAVTGSDDTPLQSVGIVAGDLIKILPSSASAASTPREAPVRPREPAQVNPSTESRSEPKLMERATASASEANVSASSSLPVKDSSKTKEEIPISLLSEAKDGQPPPSLISLFSECSPASPSQAVNLVVHLTMLECGFHVEDNSGPSPGWKEMVATIHYSHNTLPEFRCTLVLVTMGEVKQVMASFQQQESEISVKLMVGEYVQKPYTDPIAPEKLIRLSQLSHTLRNRLLHPLQVAAHQALGVPAPWHLSGLPHELLLIIASTLDSKAVLSLGQSCKRLHSVMEDHKLWRSLFKRDFKSLFEEVGNANNVDWKGKYKEAVNRRKQWKRWQEDPNMPDPENDFPKFYPSPFGPPLPTFPGMPPRNPIPYPPQPPQPNPVPNPFYDPDSPYFMGEIPPMPGTFPGIPDPLNPMFPRGPRPGNPFAPPFMPTRPRTPRGPRFDYFGPGFM